MSLLFSDPAMKQFLLFLDETEELKKKFIIQVRGNGCARNMYCQASSMKKIFEGKFEIEDFGALSETRELLCGRGKYRGGRGS